MSLQGADFFGFFDFIVTDTCLEPADFFPKRSGMEIFAHLEPPQVLSASPAMLGGSKCEAPQPSASSLIIPITWQKYIT